MWLSNCNWDFCWIQRDAFQIGTSLFLMSQVDLHSCLTMSQVVYLWCLRCLSEKQFCFPLSVIQGQYSEVLWLSSYLHAIWLIQTYTDNWTFKEIFLDGNNPNHWVLGRIEQEGKLINANYVLKPELVVSLQDDYNVYTAIQNNGFFLRQENRAKTFLLSKINGLICVLKIIICTSAIYVFW